MGKRREAAFVEPAHDGEVEVGERVTVLELTTGAVSDYRIGEGESHLTRRWAPPCSAGMWATSWTSPMPAAASASRSSRSTADGPSAAGNRHVSGARPPRPVRGAHWPEVSPRASLCPLQPSETGDEMTLELEALETSFDLVAPRGDELMDVFYARLFAAAPGVKPLFAGTDLKKQKTMLLGTLVLLRKSLRDLDAIVPKLRELGARHVANGAAPSTTPLSARP
jgi:hypothetical protein